MGEINLNPQTLDEAKVTIAFLIQRILALEEEVRSLKAQLAQNSSNSSRPPSSDPPWKPRKPPEEPSGRKPGGQPGHKGKARDLVPPEKVNKTVNVTPDKCGHCGATGDVLTLLGEAVIHQLMELPEFKAFVTQYNLLHCRCGKCGWVTRADLPADVPASPFGPGLMALCALLTAKFKMSRRDVEAFLADVLGIDISLGAVNDLCERVSEAVAPAVAQVATEVAAAQAVHADETGWRQRGDRRWMWTATASDLEYFIIAQSRGRDSLEQLLPETFNGSVTCDRWRPYERFADISRQTCHSHLRRDSQGLIDRGGAAKAIGEMFLAASNRMFTEWHAFKRNEFDRSELHRRMRGVRISWGRSVSAAMACRDRKAAAFGRDLNKHWHALWTFIYEEGVEPTNNDAERALRKAVIWRKCSFGTQSDRGSRFVARMMTVIGTAKRRGIGVYQWLVAACRAAISHQPAPLLNPA